MRLVCVLHQLATMQRCCKGLQQRHHLLIAVYMRTNLKHCPPQAFDKLTSRSPAAPQDLQEVPKSQTWQQWISCSWERYSLGSYFLLSGRCQKIGCASAACRLASILQRAECLPLADAPSQFVKFAIATMTLSSLHAKSGPDALLCITFTVVAIIDSRCWMALLERNLTSCIKSNIASSLLVIPLGWLSAIFLRMQRNCWRSVRVAWMSGQQELRARVSTCLRHG